MTTREDCKALDSADPVAPLRDLFALPADTIYLDGNSLGALPRQAPRRAQEVIEHEWGEGLIGSWNTAGWWQLPTTLGDRLAPILGADAGEVVVTDTTSMNLFKVLATALKIQQSAHPGRKTILAERDSFPTDLYMIGGFMDFCGSGYRLQLFDHPDDLAEALSSDTAVVVISHVNYRTGYLYDMAQTTAQVHQAGALMIWDLCHSAGAVPVDLKGSDSDFAVSCTYKYLNGGPGSPALLWVHPRHQDRGAQPLSGWWGHSRPFDMEARYSPASGIRRFLTGTQPIVSMSLIQCGLEIFERTSVATLRKKSLALTDLFIELVEQECSEYGVTLVTPRDHAKRGSHVSFGHENAFAIIQALIERNVIGDYREPGVMRFGVAPLYIRYVDLWNAVRRLKQILQSRAWDTPRFKTRHAVT